MRVIYCPIGQDPMAVARQVTRRREGGGLGGNWWLPVAIVGFLVVGFTVGPLKGFIPEKTRSGQPVQQPVQPIISAPIATPTPQVFCNLPMGGMILNGDTAWVDLQTKVTLYRCENGQLAEVESVSSETVSP